MYTPKGLPGGSKPQQPPAPPKGGSGVSGPVTATPGVTQAMASIKKKLSANEESRIAACSFNRGMLHGLMLKYGLRNDWHEPDEANIRARVIGDHLDNAFGVHIHEAHHLTGPGVQEYVVILEHGTAEVTSPSGHTKETWKEIARFNLCDLLANLATQIPAQCASCNGYVDVGDGR